MILSASRGWRSAGLVLACALGALGACANNERASGPGADAAAGASAGAAAGANAAGASGTAGAAGDPGAAGDQGAAGVSPTGAAGASAGAAGDSGAAGTGAAGATDGAVAGPGGPAAVGPFACNEMIGLWVMSQWYGSFEKGVDNATWQYTFVHHGYLEMWADPASGYWKTGVNSKCTAGSATPDRVIFLPFSLSLKTLDEWQTNLAKVVDNIKAKFVGVKRIEIITTIRSPDNQLCANDKDSGTIVPDYVDQAVQATAAQSGGLVVVGPKIAVKDCSWWAGGTDSTGAGNTGVGQLYSDYYKSN